MRARAGKRAPTRAQIERWQRVYGAAHCSDGEPYTDLPTFAEAHKIVHALVGPLLALDKALAQPFATGAAAVIAKSIYHGGIYQHWRSLEDNGSNIEIIGECLAWGTAGENPAVLDRMRAAHEQERKRWAAVRAANDQRREAEQQEKDTPERRMEHALFFARTALRILAKPEVAGVLTVEQRRNIYVRLATVLKVTE